MKVEQDPPPSDSLPPGEGEFTRVVRPFKVAVGSLGEGASQTRLKPRTTCFALSNHPSHQANRASLQANRRNLVAPPFLRDCFVANAPRKDNYLSFQALPFCLCEACSAVAISVGLWQGWVVGQFGHNVQKCRKMS